MIHRHCWTSQQWHPTLYGDSFIQLQQLDFPELNGMAFRLQ
jgi:hypothetical protein